MLCTMIAQALTSAQLADFRTNGYLLLPDVLSPDTVAGLLSETERLLDGIDMTAHPRTRFSTGDGDKEHVGDRYFLESGDKIRFFFEEAAFAPDGGELLVPVAQAVNKIGHYLHHLSPAFRAVTVSSYHADLARALGFRDPRVAQSMVICKPARVGGAVPPHQDSTFLYTGPPSAVGLWYALQDAGDGNGGLSFAAGSHRRHGIEQRFVRLDGGSGGTAFAKNAGARFPPGEKIEEENEEEKYEDTGKEEPEEKGKENEAEKHEEKGKGQAKAWEGERYDRVSVKAGSMLLIHGNVLHRSEKNVGDRSRWAYTFHIVEGAFAFDDQNWLRPPDTGFTNLHH